MGPFFFFLFLQKNTVRLLPETVACTEYVSYVCRQFWRKRIGIDYHYLVRRHVAAAVDHVGRGPGDRGRVRAGGGGGARCGGSKEGAVRCGGCRTGAETEEVEDVKG